MRIGVVTASYPRSDGDAAGSFVHAHVEALRTLGHDVDVVGAHTIASPLFRGAGAPDELERGGLRTYVEAARFTARLTREVTRRAHDWELIVAHWLTPSALAALPTSAPLLAIAHGGDVHLLRRLRLLGPVLRALRARGARLAFVSDELRSIARGAAPGLRAYLDAALVQPMGVDVARFTAIPRRPTTPPTVLVAARLVPVKGVDVALAAHRLLATPTRLVVAGDGPERGPLERARGATTSIELVGQVDLARRDALLGEASVVVIPSRVLPNGRTEGTPMIALEALAAGVPVIATSVGGLRELPGITRVRPEDPRALAAAIARVLAADVATRSPERGGDRLSSDHSIDRSIDQLDWPQVARRLHQHATNCAICETADSTGRRTA